MTGIHPEQSGGRSATRPRLAAVIVVAATLVIAVATLRPGPWGPTESRLCLICGQYGTMDALLNVLLFVPLGVGFGLTSVKPARAVAVMIAYSIAIEALQLRIIPGRDASAGDVVTNSLGGALGCLLGMSWPAVVAPAARSATRLAAGWLGIWVLAQILVAYSFVPSPTAPPYYGQIDRPRGFSRPAFPGDVLAASVSGLPLARGALADAPRLASLVSSDSGARFHVLARSGGPVAGRAEIAVISGPGLVRIAGVEQDGAAVVFGVRTGADRLRLRTYRYRLPEIFRSGDSRLDTVVVEGRFTRRVVDVSATARGERRARQFVPRLSQGWILFTPMRVYVDDDAAEVLVSILFAALLIAPAGWWMAFAVAGRARPRLAAGAMVLVVTAGGLAVIPAAFGLQPSLWWEWVAVLTGATLGIAAGAAARGRTTRDAARRGSA